MSPRILFTVFLLTLFLAPSQELEAKKRLRDLVKEKNWAPKQHKNPFPNHAVHLELINPNYEGFCTGMFSVFNYVVGCLDLFECGEFTGINLNFGEIGLYYDKEKGRNWWSYYCEPIVVGAKGNSKSLSHIWGEASEIIYHTEIGLTRERVHQLISKYVHFKPEILQRVDQFCQDYFFLKPVIGVHYRGTDKDSEAKRVSYSVVKKEIQNYLESNKLEEFLIFVATDEEQFLDYMIDEYPDACIFIPAERSIDGAPLHTTTKEPYQQGLESLMDCIILSRTDFLIRTSSNLSLWSTYLNPNLPVVVLNKRRRY